MIDGHTLLADWLFLFAWIVALIYTFFLAFPERFAVKGAGALLPLSVGLVAAGLWVL